MKKLQDLQSMGMTYEKSYCDKFCYGQIESYLYLVTTVSQNRRPQFIFSTPVVGEGDLQSYMNHLVEEGKIVGSQYQNNILTFAIAYNKKQSIEEIMQLLKDLSLFLSANQMRQVCPICLTEGNVHIVSIHGVPQFMCEDCLKKEEESLVEPPKSNVGLGIIGGIIGSLIGAVAWVLVYQLGYIAYIIGFLFAIGTFYGYEKLSKRMDKKGTIICMVIGTVMIIAAELACVVLDIQSAYNSYYGITVTISDVLSVLPAFFAESSVLATVIEEAIIGLVCFYASIIPMALTALRKDKHIGKAEIIK